MISQSPKKKPTLEEWRQLRSLLRDKLPAFWNKLQESDPLLRIEEVDVCLLIRLQFPVKEIETLRECLFKPSQTSAADSSKGCFIRAKEAQRSLTD